MGKLIIATMLIVLVGCSDESIPIGHIEATPCSEQAEHLRKAYPHLECSELQEHYDWVQGNI